MSLVDSLQESSKKGNGIENLVFKQNVNVRFSKKDAGVTFRILPAIFRDADGNPDKTSYFAYRDADDRFTDWVVVYKQHRFIGQKLTILSPHFFTGTSVEDPVERLWEVAKAEQRFFAYICKNPADGKFTKDAFKFALLRAPEWRCALNTIDPNEIEHPEKVSIMSVSKGAIFRKNYVNLPDQDGPPGSRWGLADELDIQNRSDLIGADTPQHDFYTRFVKGDITDPVKEGRRGGLAVCMVRLEDSPQGGLQNYNCKVLEHPRIGGTPAMMEGRYDFETETFVELDLGDYMDRVVAALSGMCDDLIYAAWENRGPHYQEALSRAGIGSGIARSPGAPTLGRRPAPESQMPRPQTLAGASAAGEQEEDDIPLEPETPPATIQRPRTLQPAARPPLSASHDSALGLPPPQPAQSSESGIKRKASVRGALSGGLQASSGAGEQDGSEE